MAKIIGYRITQGDFVPSLVPETFVRGWGIRIYKYQNGRCRELGYWFEGWPSDGALNAAFNYARAKVTNEIENRFYKLTNAKK
jgi:hypothetical protein